MIINSFKNDYNNNFIKNSYCKNKNYSMKLYAQNIQSNPLESNISRGMGLNEISFKAAFNESDFIKQRATKNKHTILNFISEILEEDKELFCNAFWGEVSEETKFSKASWYLKQKNESNNNILENINIKNFIKLYNEFYINNLTSIYEVANKDKKYLQDEKNSEIISHFAEKGNLDEYIEGILDNYFTGILEAYGKNDDNSFFNLNGNLIEQEKNKFVKKININPLLMKTTDVEELLEIVRNVLEICDKKTYDNIISNLINLSSALKNNKKDDMINSFAQIKSNILPIWENEILTKEIIKKDNNLKLIENFVKSDYYSAINYDKKMGQIFELPFFSIDEKAFLIKRINNDFETSSPTTRTFLEFIKSTVIEDDKRKIILKRVMNDVEIAENNFLIVKNKFIEDVRNQDTASILFQKKLGNSNILELILDKIEIDERHPLAILNELTNEDLNKLLDEIKPLWIDEKYKEACKREESKYDIADNFENVLSKLTIDENGKQIGINEFVENAFNVLYGKTDLLKQSSDEIIDEIMSNRSILINHDQKFQIGYTAIMQQLLRMVNLLQEQSSRSEKLHTEISCVMDKLEAVYPNRKKEIEYTRSTLEKIKDGLLTPKSIIPIAFGVQAGKGLLAASTLAGAATPALMLILYGSMLIGNVRREFNKS